MREPQAEPFIHPSAEIEPDVKVGAGSTIWHLAQIRRGATVGNGCTLGKNVFVDEGVAIGDRVKIQNNVSVYRGVRIADGVFVGPSAVFTNDLRPRAEAPEWHVVTTEVERGAAIGANATIVCGTRIGEHAMIAAGAVLTHSVAPHELVGGNPARHLGWVCACGDVLTHDTAPPPSLQCARCRMPDSGAESGVPEAAARHIAIAQVQVGPEEELAALDVLRSGMLAQGKRVGELEEIFAKIHGVHHAVAVNSGTTALVAAMQALGVRPGDEVITSPFSFAATLNAIIQAGGRARFADIRDDFTIDPDAVADLVNQRTVMLLPVHLYGLPADMEPIRALADRHGLAILEDAAQAVGATYHGQPVGSFGVGAFSLYATKNVTSGEGGIITTDDVAVADRLKVLRNQGMAAPYQYEMPGHNYRLTDLQAALVVPQLHRLDQINGARAANAELLNEGLHDVPGLIPPHAPAGRTHAWHQYTVRLLPDAPIDRDTFRERLSDARIDTACYYPKLMHDYACYRDHPLVAPDPTPNAARIAQQVVSLPAHPGVTRADGHRIINEIRCVMGA